MAVFRVSITIRIVDHEFIFFVKQTAIHRIESPVYLCICAEPVACAKRFFNEIVNLTKTT
jgi:hypothetical protein